ncbi:MAG: hypothetical protein J6V05_03350 [Alistipes sp.]|nr:hypothetical protein [Alistipes sp.]
MKKDLQQDMLDVTQKLRSNIFNWKGQFTPQFVEYMLSCYTDENSVVADPFLGSGTVLSESIRKGLSCVGFEVNPSAYYMASFFEYALMNDAERYDVISEVEELIKSILSGYSDNDMIYNNSSDYRESYCNLLNFASKLAVLSSAKNKSLLLNILFLSEKDKKKTLKESIMANFEKMKNNLQTLPHGIQTIKANLGDARNIGCTYENCIDFILTSPPYINVFNYHQNYRGIIESFGYDVLSVANSEIGANRKHRSNRFKTVVQYAIDMGQTLQSCSKALKVGGRMVFVVGRISTVRGTYFQNSRIIKEIVDKIPSLVLEEENSRQFTNRYGENIIEDILTIKKVNTEDLSDSALFEEIGYKQLECALHHVKDDVKQDILDILNGKRDIQMSPIYSKS